MSQERSEFLADMLHKLAKLDYIRPGEIPNIDLYMDQVTTFMDSHLESTKRNEADKILTKTMINNYAKNNLLPPPVRKKYSHDHMITLMFIYYFKTLMSISDIQAILGPLTERFFDDKGSISLEHIYKEIYQSERDRLPQITKDIISMYRKADNSFSDVENDEDREYLQTFSFICYLCFDMYIKKEMVENIIDEFNTKNADTADSRNSKDKNKDNRNS
jgi:DNA-binding transcriptional MerR regulator